MKRNPEPYEYRVTWRREEWRPETCDQIRKFDREQDLTKFVAKLRGEKRPDLSPLTRLEVTRRPVGPWEAA